jgi:hypothetical protein
MTDIQSAAERILAGREPPEYLMSDARLLASEYLKLTKAREPFPACAFCGRDDDLGRALDKRVCARCWNNGLRLPYAPAPLERPQ